MLVPPFRVVLKTPVDSALHLSITMASADFCAFSTAFGSGYVFQRLPHRPPWVPHVSFTPSTCLIYPIRFRVAIGLYLGLQTCPRMRPYMRFLFVRPELCPRVSRFPESSFLQILPRGRHPCFRLCPSHYRADSGLTPVRNVRRQAHQTKRDARYGRPLNSAGHKNHPSWTVTKKIPLNFGPSVSGTEALPAQPGTVCSRSGFC